jgi:hypothetical protein
MTNAICAGIYITLGIICLFLFGEGVEPNIIRNMATRAGWSSFVLRVVFCIVLLMHIPYIFHPLKEAVLVFNQEFNSRSISEGLEQKIKEARQKKHDLREEEAEPLKQEDGEPLHLETDISYSLDTVMNAS